MDGVLIVDKPQEWTSHDVCQYVKKKFGFGKVGHAGTLDPNATGVLVLLINRMTKLSDQLLCDDKEYEGTVQLGIRTTSFDSDGDIVETNDISCVTPDHIHALQPVFTGEMEQLPPMFSAVKQGGVRLYKLARKGKVVERKPRRVTVHTFSIREVHLPYVDFFVAASKGFYVRTLADDIGNRLGCGGTLTALRRTKSGIFSIDEGVTVDAIQGMKTVEELQPYMKNTILV